MHTPDLPSDTTHTRFHTHARATMYAWPARLADLMDVQVLSMQGPLGPQRTIVTVLPRAATRRIAERRLGVEHLLFEWLHAAGPLLKKLTRAPTVRPVFHADDPDTRTLSTVRAAAAAARQCLRESLPDAQLLAETVRAHKSHRALRDLDLVPRAPTKAVRPLDFEADPGLDSSSGSEHSFTNGPAACPP